MNDTEKIQSFAEMVEATEKLVKPWRIFCGWLLVALIITNLIWGFVHWRQLKYAYMTPETFSQTQDYESMQQEQNHGKGAAAGD